MIAGAYSDGQSSKTEPATLHRQGEWVEIRDSNNKTLRRVALSLVNITWGALPDPTTARTYALEMQGETSSAAANYVQSGPGGTQAVVFNGMLLERKQLEDFFKQYRHYPLPGNYWYDPVSGLYGAVGFDAFGYLRPGHQYGPCWRVAEKGTLVSLSMVAISPGMRLSFGDDCWDEI